MKTVLCCPCKANFTRGEAHEKPDRRDPTDTRHPAGGIRQGDSSLETGRYNPSIFLAYKIARFFDLTIEEVFLFEESGGGT